MIRQMVGPGRFSRLVALATVFGVASIGTTPLVASASGRPKVEGPAPSGWSFQVLDGKGHVVDIEKAKREAVRPAGPSQGSVVPDLDQLRQQLRDMKNSEVPSLVRIADRMQRWVDLASATSAAERSRLIKRFPVKITTSPSTDGRAGTVKSFAADGKTRVRVFVPTVSTHAFAATPQDDQPSGPAINVSDGQEECYGGQPGPCATPEQMDELVATIAQAQSDVDAYQVELDVNYAEYAAHCDQSPWDCGDLSGDSQTALSGPSACAAASCWGWAGAAVALVATTATGLITAAASVLPAIGAAALASNVATDIAVATIATSAMAGAAVGTFVSCKLGYFRTPTVNVTETTGY